MRLEAGATLHDGQKYLPIARRDESRDVHGPDAADLEHREDVAEARVVVEVEPQACRVHKNEFAGHAHVELVLARHELLCEGLEIV